MTPLCASAIPILSQTLIDEFVLLAFATQMWIKYGKRKVIAVTKMGSEEDAN